MNDLVNAGQPWIADAVAEQEEHVKRMTSCGGTRGLAHSWETFSVEPGGATYSACWRSGCRVTRTPGDYAAKHEREMGD